MKYITFTLFVLVSCQRFYSPQLKTKSASTKNKYQEVIQPIFDSKCIACHSCYNAPCQLKLTSFEGLQRGAHQSIIYDFPTLEAKDPTRLFIDAHNENQWRKKGFFPVTSKKDYSLLNHLINNKGPYRSLSYKESEKSNQCSKNTRDYPVNNYNSYMPYGLPPLSSAEIQSIKSWEKLGKQGPLSWELEERIITDNTFKEKIVKWEKLFNQNGIQSRLSSRYIYEHLFLAHLYFSFSKNQFFRLVRSETRTGRIKELGTVYPFDKPDRPFFYRLRPVTSSIVLKSHIPFPLNEDKFKKWSKDFYQSDWNEIPKKMPAYGRSGANPFETFKSIPAIARYRFFLEEAAYHIMTFIKGPVCRGPTALNVINDHFWVTFLDPTVDPLVNSKELEKMISKKMVLPAQIKDDFKPFKNFRKNYWDANKLKMEAILRNKKNINKKWLWNGKKENTNSLITVYRHFDSAQVLRGARGVIPKTVWTFDYHVFETVYYNLTAGYNVFGPLLHQVNSRLFMELSRISSEDLFLSFLKQDSRKSLRSNWNRNIPKHKKGLATSVVDNFIQKTKDEMVKKYTYNGEEIQTELKSTNVTEFKKEVIDNFFSKKQINSNLHDIIKKFDLSGFRNKAFKYLPNTIILKVKSKKDIEYYTLILNKAHYNVSMMFLETERREFKNDHFDIISGIASSYANLFIIINDNNLNKMISELKNINNSKDAIIWIKKYGLLRNQPDFWKNYNDFSRASYNPESNEQGWLDLNRYSLLINGDQLVKRKFSKHKN